MRHYAWSLVNSLAYKGLSVFFAILLGNLLDPKDMGGYLSLMLLLSVLVSFALFDLGSGTVHKLNDANLIDKRNDYFSVGLLLTLALSLLTIMLLALFYDAVVKAFALHGLKKYVPLIAVLVPLQMVRGYCNRVLQANLLFKVRTMINVLAMVLQIALSLLFIWQGYHIAGVMVALCISNALAAFLVVYHCLKQHHITFGRGVLNVGKDLVRFSSMIYLGTIAVFLDSKVDLLLVNKMMLKEQVAIYNYALEFSLILLLLGNSISQVSFPKFSRMFSGEGGGNVDTLYCDCLNFTFAGLSLLALAILLHVQYIIPLLLPPIYLKMIPPLTILFVGITLFASFSSVGAIFTAKGIPLYGLIPLWLALMVNVGLNLLLIPRYGLNGAAVATVVSFLLRVVIVAVLAETKIGTGYSYSRLVIAYGFFVAATVAGVNVESLILREILLLAFVGVLFICLIPFDRMAGLFREMLPQRLTRKI